MKKSHTTRQLTCPVCNTSMCNIADTYFLCKNCKYMFSNEQSGGGAEAESIEAIREKNFRYICKVIKKRFPSAKTILDVGCSKGHFLKVARDSGFLVTGLEPDERLAEEARSCDFDIINDFFPQQTPHIDKKYDVIIFNDSFEHIPNLQEILQVIKTHLTDCGCVIVSIPTSDGLIVKSASVLYKLGIKSPYERMWQKGFSSPHVHYFNLRNLKKFFENNDFVMTYSSYLLYYTLSGLWRRISCKSSFFVSIFAWLFFVFLYPLLSIKREAFMACFSLKKEMQNETRPRIT
jgi:SAM-dependent methyltransferase